MYEEYAMELFGHAPSTEMTTFNILNDFYFENELDAKSLVFYVKLNNIVVASCRIIPISLNKDFLAKVSKFNIYVIPERSTIIERLVVVTTAASLFLFCYIVG